MSPEGSETFRDKIIGIILSPAPPYIRPGALAENAVGKGKGDEGTGLIALYTHLRVSLDCYPLVTLRTGAMGDRYDVVTIL
jgi:hypothetical protein